MVTFIFTKHKNRFIDKPIRAWEGDNSSHVSIKIGDYVYDATLMHGVAKNTYDQWLKNKIITEEYMVVVPEAKVLQLIDWLNLLVENKTKYDIFKIVGFVLLRDIESYDKFICSELAIKAFNMITNITLPGRQGRQGVRLAKNAISVHVDTVNYVNGLR
jgi:hypothetical protein